MNALAKIKEIAELFRLSGIEEPAREAEMLVTGLVDIDKATLYMGDTDIPDNRAEHINKLAFRRTLGEPLQYLVGYVPFCGLRITVGTGVLIPRPETELLAEEAIKRLRQRIGESENRSESKRRCTDSISILDLCTGSGCIALAIASHFPEATVYGSDASATAIEYAVHNAALNNIRNIHFMTGDLFTPLSGLNFDFIVSNPPYVRRDEIPMLQREIKDYEPVSALDGGIDGLDFYRRIFNDARAYLRESGVIMLEAGFDQADAIRELAENSGFTRADFIKDFAGIERIFTATLPGGRRWN